ncbi:MAG TPA: M56 family metallopeptidase [Tepidisphaeraceae bacterium]|nr:M56 family metallopeptidase [Tepidisphaeraceae bacterium]
MDPADGLERLDALFAWVVRASWQASVVVLLVLGAQWALGRRVGANWRYALWLLVAVRLAAPALPGSGFSLFNAAPGGREGAAPPVRRERSEASAVVRVVVLPEQGGAATERDAPAAAPAADVVPPRAPLSFREAAALAWLAGVLLLCVRLLWVNVRFYRRVRRLPVVGDPAVLRVVEQCRREIGIRGGVPVLIGSEAEGPALLGLFRPKLLLPREVLARLTADELRLVFLHELAHLRRRDVLAEWVLTLVQTVHWFNPAIWLACARCRADRELACDAAVLSLAARAGGDGRGAYGRTILKLAGAPLAALPRPLAAVGILEGRAHLKRRIRMIASYDSPKWYRSLLAMAAIALVGCVALTDAKEPPASQRDVAGAESAAVRGAWKSLNSRGIGRR